MEAKIRRGRLLREILKQDRLTPLPITFQLAWLVAYNEGLLDTLPLETVADLLERLAQQVTQSKLRLEDDRERWVTALKDWLGTFTQEM
jgi:F-type H+-transporting ATPase subunit alpha